MITGGSSSGVAVAVQALCQEAGIIFMAGLTHSNDTTGKDKKANGGVTPQKKRSAHPQKRWAGKQ